MEKNKSIKEFLEFNVKNSVKIFKNEFSLPKLIQREIDDFDNIQWIPTENLNTEKSKENNKNDLIELLNDKKLHAELENLIEELTDINEREFQENLEYQLINNFENISPAIPKEKREYKLNLLFFEHDWEPEAYFCGYEDQEYEFRMLSGQEYLSYNYNKELFNGEGKLDYTSFMKPFLDYIEKIGEERVDFINEALFGGEYLEEIKKLFVLNGYLGIHICLSKIKDKIRDSDLPMMKEVFIFGNEHDREQLNIFVL